MNDAGFKPRDYRLPAGLRLGTVTLDVSDVDRSLAFYEGLLGMHVIARDDDGARLGTPQNVEPLLVLRPRASARAPGPRLGLYHFALLLPDRAALGALLEHLVRRGDRPGAADHVVSEALYLRDPDGLGVEVYSDRPRHLWTVRERQLVMSTDPLDVDGLIAHAAGARWSGVPAGTTVGHMHLHVGDIARARAFYHDALGFDLIVWSYDGALFMSAGGYHHHLGVNTWAGARAIAPAEEESKLASWEIVLPGAADVAAARDSLERHGNETDDDAGDIVVRDPWGTPLRLRAEPR